MNVLFILSLIVITSLFDTINQLFLKTSINSLDLNIRSVKNVLSFIFRLITLPKVWIGFIFSALSLCVWLFVLSKADLNYAFSADSMHYIFIALGSRIFLEEKVGLKRWIGTIFIIVGIILITWSNR